MTLWIVVVSKSVYMQGEAESRTTPGHQQMVCTLTVTIRWFRLAHFATGEWQYSSPTLTRYNSLSSMNLQR